MSKILVVDDESGIRAVMSVLLRQGGYETATCSSAEHAIAFLEGESVDLIITDLAMGGMSGLELLRQVRSRWSVPVIMITAVGTVDIALDAMREGAFDFIRKPLRMDDLLSVVRGALRHQQLATRAGPLPSVAPDLHLGALVGKAEAMLDLYRLIAQIACTETTVLIQGEAGTGKSLVARVLHEQSRRRNGPWREVDCARVRPDELGQILFGGGNPSASGGLGDGANAFVTGRGGTLFVDNLDLMPWPLQERLARILQQATPSARTASAAGTDSAASLDCRFLAGSRSPLSQEVENRRFVAGLGERISGLVVDLPPLRRRPEDVPLLVHHLVDRQAAALGHPVAVDDEALLMLRRYSWPGNVAELAAAVETAAGLATDGRLQVEHLPPHIVACHAPPAAARAPAADGQPGTHARRFLQQKQDAVLESLRRRRTGSGT